MRLSVGIVLQTLGDDQISHYIISQLNTLVKERSDTDYIVYVDYQAPCSMTPLFAIMHNSELNGHLGPVVCFGIKYAPLLLETYYRKYFYIPNLEHRNYNIPKEELNKWFNGEIKLIADNENLAKDIENEFNLEQNIIVIIPQFNLAGITQYLHDETTQDKLPFSLTL